MSIEQFIYTFKASAYDRMECVARDAYGNPTHIKFFRNDKLILEIFTSYDSDGNWLAVWSKTPKIEKPKKVVYK